MTAKGAEFEAFTELLLCEVAPFRHEAAWDAAKMLPKGRYMVRYAVFCRRFIFKGYDTTVIVDATRTSNGGAGY